MEIDDHKKKKKKEFVNQRIKLRKVNVSTGQFE